MIEFLRNLFSENGSVSAMRVMSLICIFASCGIAIYGLNRPVIDYSGLTLLCGTFLSAGMGGKVLQKSQEVKSKVDNPD